MSKNIEELRELRDDVEKLKEEKNQNIKTIEEIKSTIDSTKKQLVEIKRELSKIRSDKNEANRHLIRYKNAKEELEDLNKTQEKLLTTMDPMELTSYTLQEDFKSFTLFIKLIECAIGMLAFFTTVATGNIIPFIIVAVLIMTDVALTFLSLKKYTDKLIFKAYKDKKYSEFSKLIEKQKIILYNLTNRLPDITKSLEQLNEQENELLNRKNNLGEELSQLKEMLANFISKNEQVENEIDAINQELECDANENNMDTRMVDAPQQKQDKVYVKTNRNLTLRKSES